MEQNSRQNRSDRSRFTRMCIGEALVELMHQTEFENIRIRDIAARAGISRMTYYNYYHSKQEILSDYLEEIIKQYIRETQIKKDIGTFHDYAHILHCLQFFKPYTDFILTLVHAGLYSIIMETINRYMKLHIAPVFSGSYYELCYYSGALINTFICWITEDPDEPAEKIAAIIASLVR